MARTIRERADALQALPRTSIYRWLTRLWSFPDEALYEFAKAGGWLEEVSAEIDKLPYRVRTSGLSWRVPDSHEEMQSEYIRLFQIGGRKGPPCPLHSGFYERDRSRTLQQLIRFYNFFGFSVDECVMPDQICVELEFVSRLAAGGRSDPDSLLRAQKDFVGKHLAWVGTLSARVRACDPAPFYGSLVDLTSRLVEADRRYLESTLLAGGNDVED